MDLRIHVKNGLENIIKYLIENGVGLNNENKDEAPHSLP